MTLGFNPKTATMLEVKNKDGRLYLWIAHGVLSEIPRVRLAQHVQPLVIPIPTIEALGGGSVRCMMAELFDS